MKLLQILALLALPYCVQAQKDIKNIWQLMERRDLNIKEVDAWADNYFAQNGKGKGSGYKQFQRWRYEQRFHLDKNGDFIHPQEEFRAFQAAFPVGKAQSRSLVGAWTEIGPYTKNATSSWSPGQGRVTGIAIHSSDQNTIYVSSPGGGIWKTTNSGSTWTPLLDAVNGAWMKVYHLAIAASNAAVLYAGLMEEGGIIKSSNSGTTWAATGNGPTTVRKVLIHPTDANMVLAACSNGIWRSTDGGTTWNMTSSSNAQDIEFKADDTQIVIATGTGNDTWRSADNGQTWATIALPSGTGGRTMAAVSANDANIVYVVQASNRIFGKFYKSTDAGLTYTTLITGNTTGLNFFGYETDGVDHTGQADYDMAIGVNPSNVNEIHIAGIICWKSTNGGTSFAATTQWTWPAPSGNYNHADVHQLDWVGSNIYAGTDGGIYKSTNNGTSWTDLTTNIGFRQFYRIAASKTAANIISGGQQDNGSSYRQSGTTWVDWLGADGMDAIIDPNNAAIAIGTSQEGDIYKTTNSGTSKTDLVRPNKGNWVTPLAWHPTNSSIVFGGWQGFYKSSDGGTTWTLLGNMEDKMNAIAVAPSNDQYLFAVNDVKMLRSKNGGTAWTVITAPNNQPSLVTSIAISPLDPEKVWVTTSATGSNVWASTNAGDTWTDISAGLPAIAARSIAVDNNTAQDIYVGMNIGVYTRSNVNPTWTQQATGLPLVAINEVEIQKVSNKLFVATYGRGIWESALSSTVLPVELVSFTGKTVGASNDLTWQVAEQMGIKQYNLERSEDGQQDWQKIATITPNKDRQTTYTSADQKPLAVSYYRLQVVEQDGKSYYSKIVSLDRQKFKLGITQMFPNPVEKTLTVGFNAAQKGDVTVVVRDLVGRVLISKKIDTQEGSNQFNLDVQQLPVGNYYLLVTDGKRQVMEKLVKQ